MAYRKSYSKRGHSRAGRKSRRSYGKKRGGRVKSMKTYTISRGGIRL